MNWPAMSIPNTWLAIKRFILPGQIEFTTSIGRTINAYRLLIGNKDNVFSIYQCRYLRPCNNGSIYI